MIKINTIFKVFNYLEEADGCSAYSKVEVSTQMTNQWVKSGFSNQWENGNKIIRRSIHKLALVFQRTEVVLSLMSHH